MDSLNDYEQKRYRVLFEIWFPDHHKIELTSKLCEECGFVTYAPRPSADDIKAKYLFLSGISKAAPSSLPAARDQERARLLYRTLKRNLPDDRQARVLDYGGGDGRLMSEFLKTKNSCYLVDYSDEVCPGITRVGSTEDDIPNGAEFDLIICSHVIEHVADPLQVLTKLKGRLEPNGAIYVELPMEIWGAAPLQKEPVTHVNFFILASTKRLFERAGLIAETCKLGSYPHSSGRTLLCIRAIGRPGTATRSTNSTEGPSEAERLLRPDFALKLKRRMLMPSTIPEAIFYKAKTWMERH